jgi:allophanate hydrolase subunit 1
MTTEELRRLLQAATPGPYQSDGCNVRAGRTPVAMRALASTEDDVEAQSRATMNMIAAAVNALPLLLDVVDAASSINVRYQDKALDAALEALEDVLREVRL